MTNPSTYIRWFDTLTNDDVGLVGGKNASLGEMTQALTAAGIRVPPGFATTAQAYWDLLDANDLRDEIAGHLDAIQKGNVRERDAASAIRRRIETAVLPDALAGAIRSAYRELGRRLKGGEPDVAVRSSATAEDLPTASFAGQQESFLNICGEAPLLKACRRCFASLFTERAVAYRTAHGFDHLQVALSVGVQQMVRADTGSAGVLFTIDTDTGFPDVVLLQSVWGFGETIVKGLATPDQFVVYTGFGNAERSFPVLSKTCGTKRKKMVSADAPTFEVSVPAETGDASPTRLVDTTPAERERFSLTDDEVQTLARWGEAIEAHYGRPMDVEWAKDGPTGDLYVVQARPETVHAQQSGAPLRSFRLLERGAVLVTGQGVGTGIVNGSVVRVDAPGDPADFPEGAILVAETTDPDWVPIMRRAGGIVTDHGGRTSHAAIVSRELGVPAVVGTETATRVLDSGRTVTVSCAGQEQGVVYDGALEIESAEQDLSDLPETKTQVMMNVASPSAAMRWWRLPVRGIGLARLEYLINQAIQVHPLACTRFDQIDDSEVRSAIERLSRHHDTPADYFVDSLARGIATIAASQYPRPVVVRTSDFKTNEYAQLLGGRAFEPDEENPMLGWRGASRYYSDDYRDGFALECRAIHRARSEMGFTNIVVMVPFCRTPEEADRVLAEMAGHGLARGEDGLNVYVMAEIPSNVLLAEAFAERFDGFSIGSNDLTQLVLGVDRDSERLAPLFDERQPAVKAMIEMLIQKAHARSLPVEICGQGPSDHPDFAAFLVEAGIDAISVLPDSVAETIRTVARVEHQSPVPTD